MFEGFRAKRFFFLHKLGLTSKTQKRHSKSFETHSVRSGIVVIRAHGLSKRLMILVLIQKVYSPNDMLVSHKSQVLTYEKLCKRTSRVGDRTSDGTTGPSRCHGQRSLGSARGSVH
jgi:hypothetical protein